ncbi:Cytochrome c oxidase subunit 7A [Dispira parvispora]|uniref:Cytochrome c oxidase subunit 9, mitochondrial n=1 Tax=Dispira parvispora TaxID=1520584 RepID=A0A9W8E587_9FUNG|nr:Cytochrome c oxidase subunit 7A [Dispira parvispora]
MSAIAPITGKLRRTIMFDLVAGIGIGVAFGYYFWYGPHNGTLRKYDSYYAKLNASQNKDE